MCLWVVCECVELVCWDIVWNGDWWVWCSVVCVCVRMWVIRMMFWEVCVVWSMCVWMRVVWMGWGMVWGWWMECWINKWWWWVWLWVWWGWCCWCCCWEGCMLCENCICVSKSVMGSWSGRWLKMMGARRIRVCSWRWRIFLVNSCWICLRSILCGWFLILDIIWCCVWRMGMLSGGLRIGRFRSNVWVRLFFARWA